MKSTVLKTKRNFCLVVENRDVDRDVRVDPIEDSRSLESTTQCFDNRLSSAPFAIASNQVLKQLI